MRFGALQPAVEPLALVRLAQEVRRDVVDRLLQLVALGDEQVRLAGDVLDLSHRPDLRVRAQTSGARPDLRVCRARNLEAAGSCATPSA